MLRRSARVRALGLSKSMDEPSTAGVGSVKTHAIRASRRPKAREGSFQTAGLPAPSDRKVTADSPSTPPPKRRRRDAPSSHVTATPSAVPLMTVPSSPPGKDEAEPKTTATIPVHRAAEPHATNALLVSPGTSRLVTYASQTAADPSSPTTPEGSRWVTTTSNLLQEACAHLVKVDPELEPVIKKHPCPLFTPQGLAEKIDPFRSLVTGIMAQQVRSRSVDHACHRHGLSPSPGKKGRKARWVERCWVGVRGSRQFDQEQVRRALLRHPRRPRRPNPDDVTLSDAIPSVCIRSRSSTYGGSIRSKGGIHSRSGGEVRARTSQCRHARSSQRRRGA